MLERDGERENKARQTRGMNAHSRITLSRFALLLINEEERVAEKKSASETQSVCQETCSWFMVMLSLE